MNATDLFLLCKEPNASASDKFLAIVDGYLRVFGMSQRELAEEFEVSESTVSRWANGVARPHPGLRKLVVASILKRARRATTRNNVTLNSAGVITTLELSR